MFFNKEGTTMRGQEAILASAFLILTACQSMGMGGDGMPTVTRTGMVKDIIIREDVTPATLTANPGDEIRWINKRQGDARVVFLDPVMEMLSCQRNFGGLLGNNRNQFTANLGSNDSASVCFKNSSQIRYVVRADSTLPSGEANFPGTIMIGSEERSSMKESTSEPMREAAKAYGQVDEPMAK
jgi:plastocyanin